MVDKKKQAELDKQIKEKEKEAVQVKPAIKGITNNVEIFKPLNSFRPFANRNWLNPEYWGIKQDTHFIPNSANQTKDNNLINSSNSIESKKRQTVGKIKGKTPLPEGQKYFSANTLKSTKPSDVSAASTKGASSKKTSALSFPNNFSSTSCNRGRPYLAHSFHDT